MGPRIPPMKKMSRSEQEGLSGFQIFIITSGDIPTRISFNASPSSAWQSQAPILKVREAERPGSRRKSLSAGPYFSTIL